MYNLKLKPLNVFVWRKNYAVSNKRVNDKEIINNKIGDEIKHGYWSGKVFS